MGEIRAAFQEFVATVMTEVFASPIAVVLLLTWAALMLIVGIITSMRWTGRQFRRVRRTAKPRNATFAAWAATPKPGPRSPSPQLPPRSEPFPLRWDKGPRDW